MYQPDAPPPVAQQTQNQGWSPQMVKVAHYDPNQLCKKCATVQPTYWRAIIDRKASCGRPRLWTASTSTAWDSVSARTCPLLVSSLSVVSKLPQGLRSGGQGDIGDESKEGRAEHTALWCTCGVVGRVVPHSHQFTWGHIRYCLSCIRMILFCAAALENRTKPNQTNKRQKKTKRRIFSRALIPTKTHRGGSQWITVAMSAE